MASRVRVAASACLVVSGLFIAGAGGAMALADPGHGHGSSDDRNNDDLLGDIVRRAFRTEAGDDQQGDAGPGRPPDTRWGNGRDEDGQTDESPTKTEPSRSTTKTSPTDESPTKTEPSRSTTKTSPTESTTKTSPTESTTKTSPTSTEPTSTPPGKPPPPPPVFSGGGGGGGATIPLPRFKQPTVPDMQLPGELTPAEPGGAGALDAGAGAVAAAPVGPAAPIALPVIVVPPVGLGTGAGGAGAGGAQPAVPPGLPRGVTAEPYVKNIPPANLGRNAAVPASSYRIGYTEYLRTAGLPQVAALAVPGLAGILVLTGAGGLVGYRQAKAGHAVRTGTARFIS